jgi:NodT family efflux transporter outer membrane factor (OMF) lipoprotein
MKRTPHAARLLAALVVPAVAACALGPDFHPPQAPAAQRYGAQPQAAATVAAAGTAQQFVPGAPPARWWTLYGSTTLDAWVAEGLEHNRDLQATVASLQAAREELRARTGATELPTVNAQLQVSRQRALGLPDFGPPTNVYQLYAGVVQVSYDVDLFGGVRRGNEAAQAEFAVQLEELAAARQSLAANIVIAALRSAALRREVEDQARIVELAQRRAALTERRHALGAAAHRDVLEAARAAHDAAQALPALQAQWGHTRNALAVLLGRAPQDAPDDLDFEALRLPGTLPLQVPSALVQVRPDIRAAEAALHAASARVGVATANLFPQFTLTASYGSESFRRASFLHSPATVWGAGGALLQPLFEGGALLAQRRAASAELDAAYRRYEQTVLRAFGNVGDALLTLDADARALADNTAAEDAAARILAETRRRHESGSENILAVMASEQQFLQERVARTAGAGARLVDTAGLFQAIGAPDS